MSGNQKPPTKLQVQPGESVWTAMAREISQNPDSPASLRIRSLVNDAMRPRRAAAQQVVDALCAQLEQPGEASDATLAAAVGHWERETSSSMSDDVLNDLTATARAQLDQRRRQPPPVETIVSGISTMSDVGYSLGVHLHGLEGTWHRLWAAIATCRMWGDSPEGRSCVAEVRGQFEGLLGRPLSPEEWMQLEHHAHRHADSLSQGSAPSVGESSPPKNSDEA